jgi:hypothetical protein
MLLVPSGFPCPKSPSRSRLRWQIGPIGTLLWRDETQIIPESLYDLEVFRRAARA